MKNIAIRLNGGFHEPAFRCPEGQPLCRDFCISLSGSIEREVVRRLCSRIAARSLNEGAVRR
jgi:hypothetical protein